jgi:DNA polymerase
MIIIGEAPGASEDAKGLPFVGKAGRFLDTLLAKAGLSREQVFTTNIVKCRPPQNRAPKPMEIETCSPYLERQIQIIRPEIIVTLGRHSTSYAFSKAGLPFTSITQIHGKAYEVHFIGIPLTIFPSFHPASALYRESYRTILESDFKSLGSAKFSLTCAKNI